MFIVAGKCGRARIVKANHMEMWLHTASLKL